MIKKLMDNKVFFWCGGLLSLAAMSVLQVFLGRIYLKVWNFSAAMGLCAALGVVMVFYACWAVTFLAPRTISPKGLLVAWIAASVLFLSAYFIPFLVFYIVKTGWLAYYTALYIFIAFVFPTMMLAMVGGNHSFSKPIAAVVFCALYIIAYGVGLGVAANVQTDSGVIKEFVIRDTLPWGEGQKVKVILLNGQSNAKGSSYTEYLQKKAAQADYERYSGGYDTVLINYFNNNGWSSSGGAFVRTAAGAGDAGAQQFFGPEIGLADSLSAAFPHETVFIIKYTWDGSNLYEDWLSPSSKGETGEMYQAFVSFTNSCLSYLTSKNYQPEICAMCWMQGESDSGSTKNAEAYGERVAALVKDVRSEFSAYASEKGILFVDAGISDSKYWDYYQIVNEQKAANAAKDANYVYIDTIAKGLDYTQEPEPKPDEAHYDALSMIKLGNLFAAEIIKVFE